MQSALGLSLAALVLPMWLPRPPRHRRQRPSTPAPQPLLARGGAMSEEADAVSEKATPAQGSTNLAEAGSAA